MSAESTICPQCFSDRGYGEICPRCGYVASERVNPLVLPSGTLLHDQYLVGRVLGEPGGFGITYLAWDTRLETKVAVKEFMPRNLAVRDIDQTSVIPGVQGEEDLFHYGLERFLDEARTLAKFDHPNVVRVRTCFEQHRTGYIVMHYYDGYDLRSLMRQQGGRLDEKLVVAIMVPILDGLRTVHERSYLHRDIKPSNIFITHKTTPILLDFGTARMALGGRSRNLSVILTEGFAPYEQYASNGNQGPWTDIYACGATLYYLVSGTMPVSAMERMGRDGLVPLEQLAPGLSPSLYQAVALAMAFRPEDRPRRVDEFLDLLLDHRHQQQHRSKAKEYEGRRAAVAEPQIVRCTHCNAKNQVAAGAIPGTVRCGRCQQPLMMEAAPVGEVQLVCCKHCGAKNKVRPASQKNAGVHYCGRCDHPFD